MGLRTDASSPPVVFCTRKGVTTSWWSFARAKGVTTTRTNNSCSNGFKSQAANTEMAMVGALHRARAAKAQSQANDRLNLGLDATSAGTRRNNHMLG